MSMLTLTTDSNARKRIPLVGGLWGYFAAALVGVAQHSFKSNAKHNKDAPLHWSIDKSTDHAECIGRHLLDLQELLAALERADAGEVWADLHPFADREQHVTAIIDEVNALGWRALALGQTLHMRLRGAPMPFNGRLTADGAPPKRNFLGEPIVEFGPPLRRDEQPDDTTAGGSPPPGGITYVGFPGSPRDAAGNPAEWVYEPPKRVPRLNIDYRGCDDQSCNLCWRDA